ncbi:TPA: DUF1642 domain-containing protein [Streptococcus suis]
MNKQEAIEEIKKIDTLNINDMIAGQQVDMVIKNQVLDIVRQIHEPQKVVVPKAVADKIEYCKNAEGYGLFHAMDYCFNYKDSADWLECNQETFARAWLFGYEVEQEQLYTVEIPNPHSSNYTYLHRSGSIIKLVTTQFENWKIQDYNHFTESEIKQDFEWAWDAGFAKEVGDD